MTARHARKYAWLGWPLLPATLVAVALAGAPEPAWATDAPPLPTVAEVTHKMDDLYRSTSSHATVTMKVVTKHFSRDLVIESWSVGKDKALMVIRKPAREKGTATLKTDEGLWNYAPRADRLMRIPSGMLSESWMGSHFTNDDLMRENSYADDYTTTLSWATEGGTRFLKATLVPKPDAPVVYTKIEELMTADEWLPVRADYFDGADIVRTMTWKDVKVMGGRKLPATMVIVPTDKPTESTTVIYDDISFDVRIDAGVFTPRGLRSAAQKR